MNSKLTALLDHYSKSHQNGRNQIIHKLAVPLIMLSVLGMLSEAEFKGVHAGWVMILAACIYYLQFKEFKVYLTIFLQVAPMMIFIHFNPYGSFIFYFGLFIVAWVAQFVGHKIEGHKPSFFEDVQYLLIGPLWVLKDVTLG